MGIKTFFALFAALTIIFAGCLGEKTDNPPTPPANSGQNQTGAQTPPSQPGANEPLTPPSPPSGNEEPPALPSIDGQGVPQAPGSGEQGGELPGAPGTGENQTGQAQTPPVDEFAGKYTIWDISAHDTNDACWVYAGNGVYDVTDYITKHPAGMYEIFSACASNVTERFGSSTGPGNVPLLSYLEANYKIGELVEGDAKLHPDE